jgi:hypothetical protein
MPERVSLERGQFSECPIGAGDVQIGHISGVVAPGDPALATAREVLSAILMYSSSSDKI